MSRKVVQTFCIDIQELEKLEILCEKQHLSKSELVRRGLRLVLAEQEYHQPDPTSAHVSMNPSEK